MTELESVERQVTYVSYSYGRTKLVTQAEWEKSWLDWWLKINKVQNLD